MLNPRMHSLTIPKLLGEWGQKYNKLGCYFSKSLKQRVVNISYSKYKATLKFFFYFLLRILWHAWVKTPCKG